MAVPTSNAVDKNFIWMIVDVLAKVRTVVQVVHSTSVELGAQLFKERHEMGMQR